MQECWKLCEGLYFYFWNSSADRKANLRHMDSLSLGILSSVHVRANSPSLT